MLRNVIEFDDIEAIDIMTPRVDVVAVPRDAEKEEVARLFPGKPGIPGFLSMKRPSTVSWA